MSKKKALSCLYGLLSALIILGVAVIVLALSSCKTIEYVPVEKTEYKTEYKDRLRIDSVYVIKKDSVYIKDRGDTVTIYKDSEIKIYKDRFIHDTLNVVKVDSVPYMVEVEKKLGVFDQFKVDYGGYAFFLILLLLAIGTWAIARKILKK